MILGVFCLLEDSISCTLPWFFKKGCEQIIFQALEQSRSIISKEEIILPPNFENIPSFFSSSQSFFKQSMPLLALNWKYDNFFQSEYFQDLLFPNKYWCIFYSGHLAGPLSWKCRFFIDDLKFCPVFWCLIYNFS